MKAKAGDPIEPTGEPATRADASARTIAGNSVTMIVCQMVGQVVLFVLALLLARTLGKEGYGLLTFAFTYVSFFEVPAMMGTNVIINRDMAIFQGERAAVFWRSALALRTGLFVLTLLAAGTVASIVFHGNPATLAVVGWACLGLVTSIRAAYIALLRARDKAGWAALTTLGRTVLYATLAAGVVVAGGSLVSLVQAGLVATLAALLLERILAASLAPSGGRISVPVARGILRDSWPLALSAVLTVIQLRVDVLMLKALAGNAAVGIYGAAMKPVEATYIVSSALGIAAFPALSRAYTRDRARFQALARELFVLLLTLGLPVACILSPLGNTLIPALFGRDYAASGSVFSILCLHVPLGFLNTLLVNILFAARRQKAEMWASVVTTAANVATNFLLIPRYGAPGAAVATLFCQFVALIILGVMVRRAAPFGVPWPRLWKVAGLALWAFVLTQAFHSRMNGFVLGALVGAGYLIACAWLIYNRGRDVRAALRGTV